MQWYDDIPILADISAEELEQRLGTETQARGGLFQKKPYQHAQHTFGYIPTKAVQDTEPLNIQSAGTILPDESLKGSRVSVTLDRFMIKAYPGWGQRTILFDFYAQHQTEHQIEHLHFNQTYHAQNGELVGIVGYPIFRNLSVPEAGLAFKCFTVNVQNQIDQNLLHFFDSPVFQSGLQLTTLAQPAIAPLAETALGLTKQIARRHQNVPVQNFYLGLDFSSIVTRARLREGSYIAIQTDDAWDWTEWQFHPSTGRIGQRNNPAMLIPHNYIVFSVSRQS